MSGDEEPEHTYKPRADRKGVYVNGWAVRWPVIAAAVAIIGNAFVAQYRITQMEQRLDTTAERARKVIVIDNRIEHNAETIRWHRIYEHSTHGTAPNTADIEEPRP